MKMNIPNGLSCFRILLIPVFLWCFFTAQNPIDYHLCAMILVVSGLTDTLDGWIARKYSMITQLGKILDPIADKLTLGAVMVALWWARPNFWPIYTLFLLKEFLMLCGGLHLHKKQMQIEGAKWFGKLATVMFYLIMIVIIAIPSMNNHTILRMLLFLLLFKIFALVRYSLIFRQMVKESH